MGITHQGRRLRTSGFALALAAPLLLPAEGGAFTRPGTAPEPNSSDAVLVTKYLYDASGNVQDVVDNKGIVTRREYDTLGRVKKQTENYVDGTPGSDNDRITTYTYNADGQVVLQTADMPSGTDDQTTRYVYSAELTDKGSPVKSNSLLRAVIYPDSTSTVSSSALSGSDLVTHTYHADGSLATRTDQRGAVLTYAYDDAGRRTSQTVTTLPSGVTGDRRVAYAYDDLGRLDTVTTASDTGGSTVTSQVKYAYNGLGQLVTEYQDHDSAVNTASPGSGGSPRVAYAYDTTASSNRFTKGHRRTNVTYPNGRVIETGYDGHSGIDDAVSRVNKLVEDDDSSVIAQYGYLGSGATVKKEYPVLSVRLNYTDTTGDPYDSAWDRFGRITKQQWTTYGEYDDLDYGTLIGYDYGYDRAGNRTYAANQSHRSASQKYTYDNLHRLTQYKAGLIKSDNTDIEASWTLDGRKWSLDPLGNQISVDQWVGGSTPWLTWWQNTPNKANEYTDRLVRGNRSKTPIYSDDFTNSADAANWQVASGSSDTFGYSSGSLRFSSIAQDSSEPEARGIVLLGSPRGPVAITGQFRFDPGTTTGEVGYVFGYKGLHDYWLHVLNIGDQEIKVYHVQSGTKTTVATHAMSMAAGTGLHAYFEANTNSIQIHATYNSNFYNGYPSGRIGFYSDTTDGALEWIHVFDKAETRDMTDRWTDHQNNLYGDKGIQSDAHYNRHDPTSRTSPMWLEGVRLDRFETEFSVRRLQVGTTYGRFHFLFNGRDSSNSNFLRIYHQNGWGVDGKLAPQFGSTSNGEYIVGPSGVTTVDANMPAIDGDDVLWVRVTQDDTHVRIRCGEQDNGVGTVVWQSNDATSVARSSLPHQTGMLGFRVDWAHEFAIDDLTIKADRDNNGSYETTEHNEEFTLGSGGAAGYAEETLTHDAAGNLTYDGVYAYGYDAWNRLVETKKAWRTGNVPAGSLNYGSVVQENAYDGLGRRIVKAVQNSGDLDRTFHYYLDGQSVVEEHDGSGTVLSHHVWANLAGGYIDELVQTATNSSPIYSPSMPFEARYRFWAAHDANFNVIGVIEDWAALKERYEYTPYGERQVFSWGGFDDWDCNSPSGTSGRGLVVGHQGLFHDEETGLVYNRARHLHPTLGRFMQRDPLGYVDGMSAYEYVSSQPISATDPSGLARSCNVVCGGVSKSKQMISRHNWKCCGNGVTGAWYRHPDCCFNDTSGQILSAGDRKHNWELIGASSARDCTLKILAQANAAIPPEAPIIGGVISIFYPPIGIGMGVGYASQYTTTYYWCASFASGCN